MGMYGVEWAMELEEVFDIEIDDETLYSMATIRETCEYIVSRLDPVKWPRDVVERRVLELAPKVFGVERDSITLDSRYDDGLY